MLPRRLPFAGQDIEATDTSLESTVDDRASGKIPEHSATVLPVPELKPLAIEMKGSASLCTGRQPALVDEATCGAGSRIALHLHEPCAPEYSKHPATYSDEAVAGCEERLHYLQAAEAAVLRRLHACVCSLATLSSPVDGSSSALVADPTASRMHDSAVVDEFNLQSFDGDGERDLHNIHSESLPECTRDFNAKSGRMEVWLPTITAPSRDDATDSCATMHATCLYLPSLGLSTETRAGYEALQNLVRPWGEARRREACETCRLDDTPKGSATYVQAQERASPLDNGDETTYASRADEGGFGEHTGSSLREDVKIVVQHSLSSKEASKERRMSPSEEEKKTNTAGSYSGCLSCSTSPLLQERSPVILSRPALSPSATSASTQSDTEDADVYFPTPPRKRQRGERAVGSTREAATQPALLQAASTCPVSVRAGERRAVDDGTSRLVAFSQSAPEADRTFHSSASSSVGLAAGGARLDSYCAGDSKQLALPSSVDSQVCVVDGTRSAWAQQLKEEDTCVASMPPHNTASASSPPPRPTAELTATDILATITALPPPPPRSRVSRKAKKEVPRCKRSGESARLARVDSRNDGDTHTCEGWVDKGTCADTNVQNGRARVAPMEGLPCLGVDVVAAARAANNHLHASSLRFTSASERGAMLSNTEGGEVQGSRRRESDVVASPPLRGYVRTRQQRARDVARTDAIFQAVRHAAGGMENDDVEDDKDDSSFQAKAAFSAFDAAARAQHAPSRRKSGTEEASSPPRSPTSSDSVQHTPSQYWDIDFP